MPAIQFLNLTHADLGGGRAVTRPFVVGHLTAAGRKEFLAIDENEHIFKCARHSSILAELEQFEGDQFGPLPNADRLDEEDLDFYSFDYEFSPPRRRARTPGWHPDARPDDQNHMYLVGSADARMNTQYALGRLRQTKNFVAAQYDEIDQQPPDHPLQLQLTRALLACGGIRQIGPDEIVIMPVRTWHRSSPHHTERTESWPFLRMTPHRLGLGGDRSR